MAEGPERWSENMFRRARGRRDRSVATLEALGVGEPRSVGSVQDVTTQRRLEREVAVTETLDRWRTLEDSAAELLQTDRACEAPGGWR